ncbi:MAG: cell wall hydrolase [Hyphomonadaceae bacterium]|nr:cell wall hydrolase [Hyphomonadaceae bacterium]
MKYLKNKLVGFAIATVLSLGGIVPMASATPGDDDVAAILANGIDSGRSCLPKDESEEEAGWQLAVSAAGEARNQGVLGMALTVEIMINRLCSGDRRYGDGSTMGMLTRPYAFSIYNADSKVRAELLLMASGGAGVTRDIKAAAKMIYPIARAALRGWRTGMLPKDNTKCVHYKTRDAKASWAKADPVLSYRDHDFFCNVDG